MVLKPLYNQLRLYAAYSPAFFYSVSLSLFAGFVLLPIGLPFRRRFLYDDMPRLPFQYPLPKTRDPNLTGYDD